MSIRVIAALNKTPTSASGIYDPGRARVSFAAQPLSTEELAGFLKGTNITHTKICRTIDGMASQISLKRKWQDAWFVLVDAITTEEEMGLTSPPDKLEKLFRRMREDKLQPGQPTRTIIGLIPNDKVPDSDKEFLRQTGVDLVCTPEELSTVIPKLIKQKACE